jgi:hypothetical protein
MYLVSKKHSRKTKRNKSARHRAKVKAKNNRRRARIGQAGKR